MLSSLIAFINKQVTNLSTQFLVNSTLAVHITKSSVQNISYQNVEYFGAKFD